MRDRDALFLHDLLAFANEAVDLAKGRRREELETDRALKRGLTYLIQVVGEAAKGLSANFKTAHAGIAWGEIIGMRNRIVHEYWRVDLDII